MVGVLCGSVALEMASICDCRCSGIVFGGLVEELKLASESMQVILRSRIHRHQVRPRSNRDPRTRTLGPVLNLRITLMKYVTRRAMV